MTTSQLFRTLLITLTVALSLGVMGGCADKLAGPGEGGPNNGANNGDTSNNGPDNGPDNGANNGSNNGSNNGGGCGEEVCDGVDNDCDGEVDEGIACLCGPDPSCYGGPAGTRGQGICTDGERSCDGTGEFWGPCSDWSGPEVEACDDGLDNDCDGVIDNGCEPPCQDHETCGDRRDNDCDGQADEGCALCDAAETCGDGVDNDCNLLIDDGCEQCGVQEICNNGLDDNCNGQLDEGCADECAPGLERACFPGNPAQVNVGVCAAGMQHCIDATLMWSECADAVVAAQELCDNNLDDNCNGQVDEGCFVCLADELCFNGIDDNCNNAVDEGCGTECVSDQTEVCFPGPGNPDVGLCRSGHRVCTNHGFWGPCEGFATATREVCANGIDEDCDGRDQACEPVTVPLNITGDCVSAQCPASAPYPVGCSVFFSGGDSRGCVASTPTGSSVYFQEGDACGAGHVSGTLLCSDQPGEGLNESNCTINKSTRYYPTSRSGCPATSG